MAISPADHNFALYQHKIIKELKATIGQLTTQVNESNTAQREAQTKFIEKTIQQPLESIVATKTVIKYLDLPYVFEINSNNEDEIEADTPYFLYIQSDDSRGLKVPGRGGYIKNDGPGKLSYRINNGSKNKWSFPATLLNGEIDTFDNSDNINIVIIEITADTDKTRFRTRFTPGPQE